jgi:hypothetical protein
LNDLVKHQDAIEANAPILQEAIASAKAHLSDLKISEAAYEEIAEIEPEMRSLREEVVFRMYEFTVTTKKELEQLRMERDTARETAARASAETERLMRENQRVVSLVAVRFLTPRATNVTPAAGLSHCALQ